VSGTFGQWMKAKREERGLTLRDVERICEGKISNAAVSQIETGKTQNPSIGAIVLLAAAYGLMPSEVFEKARMGNHVPEPSFCPACGQRVDPARKDW
jgi:transcriptional regulator with XRE-family HTH domain